jgi:hypothetical protein
VDGGVDESSGIAPTPDLSVPQGHTGRSIQSQDALHP